MQYDSNMVSDLNNRSGSDTMPQFYNTKHENVIYHRKNNISTTATRITYIFITAVNHVCIIFQYTILTNSLFSY